mmetsp:Transcript_5101/g.6034  ORF Transcript_5101/g.6034 Transcript_5101/m.6034 type:complete len:364 (-) Transcript_5101:301-1392(-)
METLKVCLFGAGRMGQIRAKNLYSNPRAKIVYVAGGGDAGKELAKTYGGEHVSSFYEVDTSSINAVIICTGTSSHEELITAAANAGLAVFCEKPVDAEPEVIEKLFNLCASKNVPLCCSFQRRFDNTYVSAQKSIAAGDIGTPTFARVFFADHPCPSIEFLKTGGDPFMDLAPHDVDFVRWCLGSDPIEIHGTGSSSDPELSKEGVLDTAMITMKFENGCLCNIFMSRAATYGYDQRCEIFGTKGMISVENEAENACVLSRSDGIKKAKHKYSFPQRFREAFENEVNTFVETVLDGTEWPVTKDDCIAAQAISSTASKSSQAGKILQYVRPICAGAISNLNEPETESFEKTPGASRQVAAMSG